MRNYVLTDKDRKTIKVYLDEGYKLNGFGVLQIRVREAMPQLEEDFKLLRQFQDKLKAEKQNT